MNVPTYFRAPLIVLVVIMARPGAVHSQNVSAATLHVADGHLMLPEDCVSASVSLQGDPLVPFTLGGIPLQQIALVEVNDAGHVAQAKRIGRVGGELEPWTLLGDGTSLYVAARTTFVTGHHVVLIKLDASWNVLWTRVFPVAHEEGGASIGTDGRVVVFAKDGSLVRFNPDGSHDLALDCPDLEGVAVRNDGRIMLAHNDLAELAADGSLLLNSQSEEWSLSLEVLASQDGGFVTKQYALGFDTDGQIFKKHDAGDSLVWKNTVSHDPDWYNVRQFSMQADGAVLVAGVRAENGNFAHVEAFRLGTDGTVNRVMRTESCNLGGIRFLALPNERSTFIYYAFGSMDPTLITLPDTIGSLTCGAGPTSVHDGLWSNLDPWFVPTSYSITPITPTIADTLTLQIADLLVEAEVTCEQWNGIDQAFTEEPSYWLSPVPSSDRLYVAQSLGVRAMDRIIVRSSSGILYYDGPYADGVDVSRAAPGVYSVELANGLRARAVVAR